MSDIAQQAAQAPAPGTVAAAGSNGAAPPWYDTIDTETKAWLQTRGLDKHEAPAAVVQLSKDVREAQSKLRAPADRILVLPADPADQAGWKDVHRRLGVPETADQYDFSTVKMADGADLEADLVSFLRNTAQDLAIPKDRAPRLAAALVKLAAESEAADASAAAIQNGEAELRLRQNWGANYPGNMFVADRTAAMLGLPQVFMDEIKKSAQVDVIMEGLRAAGERMGEAQLIGAGGNGGGGGNQIRTKEQAAARIEELIKDADFAKRRMTPGDPGKAAREEWAHLHRMLVMGA